MAAKLKAGTFEDLADSLAGAIEAAMKAQWQAAKQQPLPEGPGDLDRHILFAAIAQGVLGYLHAHQADLLTTVAKDTADGHAHQLSFDLEEPAP
jgi:hypothetical protein